MMIFLFGANIYISVCVTSVSCSMYLVMCISIFISGPSSLGALHGSVEKGVNEPTLRVLRNGIFRDLLRSRRYIPKRQGILFIL